MPSTAASSPIRHLYSQLASQLKEVSHLAGICGLLDWDQNVMMPPGAAECRAEQMSVLAGVMHEKSTSEELKKLIESLNSHSVDDLKSELNQWELANVRDATRQFEKERRVPKDLAQQLASLQSRGNTVWVDAREKNRFDLFAPILKEWIRLLKLKCQHIDPSKPAYEILIDDYERGMKIEQFDQLFTRLKAGLVPLIARIQTKPVPAAGFLKDRKFPVDKQKEFNHTIAKDIGFDFNNGRLDVSVHPFTGGAHPTDVRMTTRYKDTDLIEGITGTIHETGHSLYEQGRNSEYYGLPVSDALSMGVHESQSLFWERMIGLSVPFWNKYWPTARQQFGIPVGVSADDFHRVINTCKPGFIRVEADEVTYPMHIILRYELEKGLFDGTIEVEDLPRLWNKKMTEYLGITPANDKEGCLQDTHWAVGLFGYFPTYTLGAIYASQFYQAVLKDIPDLEKQISAGKFSDLRKWLNENVHRKGSLYPSGDILMKQVTGEPLNAEIFLAYLTEKYSKLYGL